MSMYLEIMHIILFENSRNVMAGNNTRKTSSSACCLSRKFVSFASNRSLWRRRLSHDINSDTSVSKYRSYKMANTMFHYASDRNSVAIAGQPSSLRVYLLVINRMKKKRLYTVLSPFYYPYEKYIISSLPFTSSKDRNSLENSAGTPGIQKERTRRSVIAFPGVVLTAAFFPNVV